MNTYQIEGLSFSYPEQEQLALKQMDLTIEQGAFVVWDGIWEPALFFNA